MPDPEEKAVIPVPDSAPVVEDVTEPEAPVVDPSTTEPDPTPVSEDLDERGVPWRQRAMEYQRKVEELSNDIPNIIEKKLSEINKTKESEQKPQYSIAQLEAFAIQNPEHRPWVEEQKEQIRKTELRKEFTGLLQETDKKRTDELTKQRSLEVVMQSFPEMFIKDSQGKSLGWDQSHGMTQELGRVMQDPRLANDPQGLLIAAEIAHSRYMRNKMPQLQKKQVDLSKKVKSLEKKTLVDGGGARPVVKDSLVEAKSKFAQTGNKKDAEAFVGEYLKKVGLIQVPT